MEFVAASERWTPRKEAAFDKAIRGYAAIARRIQIKHEWVKRWFYFEPTAGSGLLRDKDGELADGSPVIALERFIEAGLHVDCLFMEHNRERYEALRLVLEAVTPCDGPVVRWEAECDDSRQVLARVAGRPLGCGPMGLVYWDGCARDEFPAAPAATWLRRHRYHDFLTMASATAPKRMRLLGRERLGTLLAAATTNVGRPREGYVSDTNEGWGWVFSFVTAYPSVARMLAETLDLHEYRSARGQAIFHELETTKEERVA